MGKTVWTKYATRISTSIEHLNNHNKHLNNHTSGRSKSTKSVAVRKNKNINTKKQIATAT